MGHKQWVVITWVVVCVTIGMTAGNFSHQGFYKPVFEHVDPDWRLALERSWYQWCMALWIWVCLRVALRFIKA